MSQERITREQTREFFIQTPALVDYLPLTPHEFRLYSHYIRVCGDGGTCWQSVRTTAASARIGLGTVVRSRDALEDKYQLIYTDKHLIEDGDNINIVIRDIWPINSQFLAMVRRYGMPSLQVAEEWLLEQLQAEDEMGTPFQSVDSGPQNPDNHFKVGCSLMERGVPLWNTPFHEGTHRAPVEHPVPLWNRARAGGTPRSTVEPNKIYNNEIPDNQIDSNQIPLIAAAGAEISHTDSIQVNNWEGKDLTPNNLVPRAEIGENDDLPFGDPIWWGGRVNQRISRRAVEQTCREYMGLEDWRDQQHIVETAKPDELLNLLLWLKYSTWNYNGMIESGIQNVPGYVRSRYQTERPPQTSQKDIDELLGQINQYAEQDKIPF